MFFFQVLNNMAQRIVIPPHKQELQRRERERIKQTMAQIFLKKQVLLIISMWGPHATKKKVRRGISFFFFLKRSKKTKTKFMQSFKQKNRFNNFWLPPHQRPGFCLLNVLNNVFK